MYIYIYIYIYYILRYIHIYMHIYVYICQRLIDGRSTPSAKETQHKQPQLEWLWLAQAFSACEKTPKRWTHVKPGRDSVTSC